MAGVSALFQSKNRLGLRRKRLKDDWVKNCRVLQSYKIFFCYPQFKNNFKVQSFENKCQTIYPIYSNGNVKT